MLGAIIGDIVGSPYEFDQGDKSTDFEFFHPDCAFTDDSVMTVAIADALLSLPSDDAGGVTVLPAKAHAIVAQSMRRWFIRYPMPKGGYGGRFLEWLVAGDNEPYHSWGNGSAMRVSAAGWLFPTVDDTLEWARITAEVTHNHPEGIKGAQSIALAIFRARHWEKTPQGITVGKEDLKAEIIQRFGYDLSRSVDEIRPNYSHKESCQESVPEALTCFFESTDFENALRLGVSIGGDTDTIGAMIGAIAEAAYGIPSEIKQQGMDYLPTDIREVLSRFWKKVPL